MGYKKVVFKGVGSMGLLHVIVKGLALLKIAILARFLTPFELGVFGVGMLVLSLFETFSELGLGPFLIQHKGKISNFIDSIFLVQILRGILLFITILVFANPIASFFGNSSLVSIITIISIAPLIKAFENPYIVLFQKELYFRKEFEIRAVSTFIDFILIIAAAFFFKSVFSIIIAFLISAIVYVVLSWLVVSQKAGIKFEKKKIVEILKFAKSISTLGVVTYLVTKIDSFLVGRFAGLEILGGYQFSQKISYDIMNDTSSIVGKVTFPVYSKIKDNKVRLKKAFLKSFSSVVFFEGLACIFLLIFAKPLILLIGGEEWVKYLSFLRLFAVYGFLMSSWGTIGALFMSLGMQDKLVKLSVLRLLILAPLFMISYQVENTELVIVSLIVSLILVFPTTYLFVRKTLN